MIGINMVNMDPSHGVELLEDADEAGKDMKKDSTREGISGTGKADQSNGKSSIADRSGWSRRDGR